MMALRATLGPSPVHSARTPSFIGRAGRWARLRPPAACSTAGAPAQRVGCRTALANSHPTTRCPASPAPLTLCGYDGAVGCHGGGVLAGVAVGQPPSRLHAHLQGAEGGGAGTGEGKGLRQRVQRGEGAGAGKRPVGTAVSRRGQGQGQGCALASLLHAGGGLHRRRPSSTAHAVPATVGSPPDCTCDLGRPPPPPPHPQLALTRSVGDATAMPMAPVVKPAAILMPRDTSPTWSLPTCNNVAAGRQGEWDAPTLPCGCKPPPPPPQQQQQLRCSVAGARSWGCPALGLQHARGPNAPWRCGWVRTCRCGGRRTQPGAAGLRGDTVVGVPQSRGSQMAACRHGGRPGCPSHERPSKGESSGRRGCAHTQAQHLWHHRRQANR